MEKPNTLLNEFELVKRHLEPLVLDREAAASLKDDCAVFGISSGHEVAISVDTLIADIHFFKNDPPKQIAQKVLRVNLSDLASSGAEPKFYFLAMSLPSTIGMDWIEQFCLGLGADQTKFGISLLGGDTTSTPGPLSLTVTVIGEVPKGKAIRRGGAIEDEDVYLTGVIGDAALALSLIKTKGLDSVSKNFPVLLERYRLPQPRTVLAPDLRQIASACIDISDGLAADLEHICKTSGIAADIKISLLPISDAARVLIKEDKKKWETIISGGDDFELLFTAQPKFSSVIKRLSKEKNIQINCIGKTKKGSGVRFFDSKGKLFAVKKRGWQHF